MKSIFKIFTLLAFSAGVSSCVEEDPSFDPDKVENVIEFYATADIQVSADAAIHPVFSDAFEVEDVVEIPVRIRYAGAHTAPEDITVTVAVSESAVAEYNKWNNESTDPDNEAIDTDAYTALPSEFFEIADMKVVIPKGQQEAVLMVKVKPTNFDFSKSYALGLRIVESSYGIISGNFSTALFNVQAKNKYDGLYHLTGSLSGHPSLSGPIDVEEHEVVTVGGNAVTFSAVYGSGGGAGLFAVTVIVTVDPATNKAVVTTGPGSSAPIVLSDPSNAWDEATQTLTLKFGWGTRVEEIKMVRTGARP